VSSVIGTAADSVPGKYSENSMILFFSSCFITNVASVIWWRQLCPHIALVIIQWQPTTLQRQYTENSKQIFQEMKLRGLCPSSYIHVSVSDLYFPKIGLPIKIGGPIVGIYKLIAET
jgi:hypothetical protein